MHILNDWLDETSASISSHVGEQSATPAYDGGDKEKSRNEISVQAETPSEIKIEEPS